MGDGRSGSTLLARLLGEVSGVWNMGEAANFVCYDFLHQGVDWCGCGRPITRCRFWGDLLDEGELVALAGGARRMRLRHWPRLARASATDPASTDVGVGIERLYRRAAAKAGASVVVDSSKSPSLALVLTRVPGLETHLVHLVRDPRAVVVSWRRPKGYLPRRSLIRVVAHWVVANACARRLRRRGVSYTLIRYEELVNDPRGVLEGILEGCRVSRPNLGFLSVGGAMLSPSCALAGNPDKRDSGPVAVDYRPWHLSPLTLWGVQRAARPVAAEVQVPPGWRPTVMRRLIWDLQRFGLTPRKLGARLGGGPAPKALIVSVPKSGTHLIERALCLHPRLYRPLIRTVNETNIESLGGWPRLASRLRPGGVLVSHLHFDAQRAAIARFHGLRTILMIRDPRDVVVSNAHFIPTRPDHYLYDALSAEPDLHSRIRLLIVGDAARGVPSIGQHLAAFDGWRAGGALVVRFESLIGERGGSSGAAQAERLHDLARHLGFGEDRPAWVQTVRARLFSEESPTFRRGQAGQWRESFTTDLWRLFDEVCGYWLERYEYSRHHISFTV